MMEFEKYINQAEDIFINGNTFDNERIDYITNLETCDLLAVPGSGKTTALLAKLYCLAQNMPFENGSGILVLAHTNHAIDEIECKLKKYCPQLFEYPNFIGTIQSFVNKFLANQACYENYNSYIRKNEDELYEKEVKNFFYNDLKWESEDNLQKEKRLKNQLYGKANYKKNGLSSQERITNTIEFLKYLDFDIINRKFTYGDKKTTLYKYGGTANHFYLEIEDWKIKLYKIGLLNYKDSFNIGNWNLINNAQIISILQNRFKYVFIDEMQDLEDFQIKIIDDIFYTNESKTIIQRIGDVNQSIFNSGKKVKIECDWKPRNKKFLKNSLRLTNEVALLVNKFILEPQFDERNDKLEVKGRKIIDKPILPHLIIINKKTTGEQIKEKFKQLITDYKLHESESNKEDGFHIIGWSTEWDNDQKSIDANGIKRYRLKDFFTHYQKESRQKKEDFDSLKKHLYLFDKEKQTLEAIRKSILNALTRVLRIEEIYRYQTDNHLYRKSNLIDFFKSQGDDFYYNFNSKLFSWCFDIITKKNYVDVYENLKKFIESESFIGLNWYNEENYFPKLISKSKDFLIKEFDFQLNVENPIYVKAQTNEIDIKLSSVHAVKGQTHCATMYIESSYYNYETKKTQIKDVLLGKNHTFKIGEKSKGKNAGEKDAQAKQALKMMYVGFSRPSHLLCFTVLKENVKDELEKFENSGWKVIHDLS
ncbi:UvrD-helicase domain-containing protein [Flavobacterium bizetiae]|uniref:UvrD-helicase domain-containing protein n=1 Tax=Flavobacterium bizetiae TaxID=2704140 RepID=UPI00375746D1